MTISHRATGAAVFGANSITPVIPASAQAGDMLLLLVAGKPYNAGVSVSGWTQLSTFTDGTVAAGTDVGSMFVTAWYKEHDGSEANPTVTEGSPTWSIVGALIMVFSKSAGDTWNTPAMVGGGDATAGTGFSVTAASNPGVTAGDACVSFAGFRSDAATPCSTHLVATQTGVTFSNTHDPATDPETTSGGDMGMCVNRATVSGTGSAAPVIAATLAASHTGSAGFIRLRITPPSPTRGQVSWAETEAPFLATRGLCSWAEAEAPIAPTRGLLSWAETEAPGVPTRGLFSWAETEAPFLATRGLFSWAEAEAPIAPTRGLLSWAETEAPLVPTRGAVSWAEVETLFSPTRGLVSWVEAEAPAAEEGRRALHGWQTWLINVLGGRQP
jgi:hypothetical protein